MSTDLNRYAGIVIFLFGTVGNILNILVLSKRPLRFNPCALFFLGSSIANLLAIISGLASRILSGWNLDLTTSVLWLCKLRIFVLFWSRNAAYWFLMLAAIDRWFLSSVHVHRRRMSTVKNTRRSIILIIFFSFLLYIQAPICYEISSNNIPFQCYGKSKDCRTAVDLTYTTITIFLPFLIMNLSSWKTVINIRRRRVYPQPINRQANNPLDTKRNIPVARWKKTDQRLLVMLLTQIILFTIFTFPLAIQRIYITATLNYQKSDLQNAIDNFIYNLAVLISFMANGIPFYIYTLTGGNVFRKALYNVIRCVY